MNVGDSIAADVKGGNDYGLDTLWFNKRGKDFISHAKYEVKTIKELQKLIYSIRN